MIIRKTRTQEDVYYEAKIEYENDQIQIVPISLGKLQQYDSKITKDTGFTEIRNQLNTCAGLHWLAANNEI